MVKDSSGSRSPVQPCSIGLKITPVFKNETSHVFMQNASQVTQELAEKCVNEKKTEYLEELADKLCSVTKTTYFLVFNSSSPEILFTYGLNRDLKKYIKLNIAASLYLVPLIILMSGIFSKQRLRVSWISQKVVTLPDCPIYPWARGRH